MVKKSSILNKIVNRFRHGSVHVEEVQETRGAAARPERARSDSASQNRVSHLQPEEVVPESKRRLSPQEDAKLAMTKGLAELSGLLRGVQSRMEDQGARLDTMGADLAKLPGTADAQLRVLQALVSQLEKQNQMNASMVETFSGLPEVMKGVQESLARSAATDERTAQTLDQFKSTMGRIEDSMGEMVGTSKRQAEAAVTMVDEHRESVEHLENSTKEGLQALRWAQEDQSNRMAKLVNESSRFNRAILVLGILGLAGLVAIFFALLGR